MNKYWSIFTVCLVTTLLMLANISTADAKRFGSGSSFGGKSSYSAPYKRAVTPPAHSSSNAQQATPSQQQNNSQPKPTNRSGLMGILGGLAIGGLLGSLFAGAAGSNLLTLVLLVAAAVLLYKLFAAKSRSQPLPAYHRSADNSAPMSSNGNEAAGFNTDVLFNKNKTAPSPASTINNVDGFDRDAFLADAKVTFSQLQRYWDEVDLGEIRLLTTDKVFADIQEQLKAETAKNHTEILKLDAELLDLRDLTHELEAVVLFDTILREDVDAQAGQVREVWHFIKAKTALQSKWLLDGIQQLES